MTKINYSLLSSAFSVPSEIVEKHLKLASHAQLKVVLYALKFGADALDAKKLDISQTELNEAVIYWTGAGVFEGEKPTAVTESTPTPVIHKTVKPSRSDVAQRLNESKEIAVVMQQVEIKLGRTLKQNEMSSIVYLIDDEGINPSVLLMIIDYAIRQNRMTVAFVESIATDWVSKGFNTIRKAEKEIIRLNRVRSAWSIVSRAFGIAERRPSKKEEELCYTWIEEWGLSNDMLRLAYDKCVDATGKYSTPYISKIIEGWHKSGFKTPEEVESNQKTSSNDASFDIDLFKKMIDGE